MALSSNGLGFEFWARDRATPVMRRMRGEMVKTADQAKELERQKQRTARGIKRGAAIMAAGVGTLMVVNKATKAFGDFEFMIASAAGKMVDGTANLKALTDAALKAGKLTQFDPAEAAQGLAELGAQGLNAKESIKALNPTLALAAASMGELGIAEAASVGMASLNAFGKTVDELPDVVNKLAMISDSSAFHMRDFQVAISQAAAQAKAGGQSFESMLSILGLLRDAGNEASSAATAYREAMRRVAGDKNAIKAMKKLGVSSVDANKEMKDLGTIIAELHPKLQKLGVQERNLALVKIFGVRGMKTYNALIASYEKQLKKGTAAAGQYTKGQEILLTRLGESQGYAAKKVDTALKTTGGQYKLLAGSWKTTVISFGMVFAKAMLPVLKKMTELLNDVTDAIKALSPAEKKLAGYTVVLGGALLTVIGAFKVMRGLMTMMSLGRLAGQYVAGQAAMAASTTANTAAVSAQNVAMATSTTRMGRAATGMRTFGSTILSNIGLLTMAAAASIALGLALSDALIKNLTTVTDRMQSAAQKTVNFRLAWKRFNRTIRRSTDYMSSFNVKLREQTQTLIKAASTGSTEKVLSKITSTVGKLSRGRQKALIGLISATRRQDIAAATKYRRSVFEFEAKMAALAEAKVHIQARQYRRTIGQVKDRAVFEHRMRTILLSDVIKQQKIESDFAEKKKNLAAGIRKIDDPVDRKKEQDKANALWKKQQVVIDAGRKKLTEFARKGGVIPKDPSSAADWGRVVKIAANAQKGAGLVNSHLRLTMNELATAYKGHGIKNATPERIRGYGELHEASWRAWGGSKKKASGYRSNYEAALKAGTAPSPKRKPMAAMRGGYQDIDDWLSGIKDRLTGKEVDISTAIREAYADASVVLDITVHQGETAAEVDAKTGGRSGKRFKPTARSSGTK